MPFESNRPLLALKDEMYRSTCSGKKDILIDPGGFGLCVIIVHMVAPDKDRFMIENMGVSSEWCLAGKLCNACRGGQRTRVYGAGQSGSATL